MTDIVTIRRALISVSDKSGLVPFAQALTACGVEILSTGGSAKVLRNAGVPVKDVSDHTGFPEIMDGRVKTLVPQIHGGILGRRDNAEHMEQMRIHAIAPIDLVVVNLYPFEATVAKAAPYGDCVENIDIGGPALIRAAAKNHDFVTVLTDPAQYAYVLAEITASGGTSLPLRRRLAGQAYARTAAYDAAIGAWFATQRGETFPDRLAVAGTLRQPLRYGENPHQQAAFYTTGTRPGVATSTQVQGKELSYNNLNDTDAAFECVAEFDAPTIAIIKHATPCGVASAAHLADAWDAAFRCDPVSPYGGIVAVNRTLDAASAEKIAAIFTEVIIAPDADEAAKAILSRKKNLRLLLTGGMPDPTASGLTYRSLAGGFLAQTRDAGRITEADLKTVTKRTPTEAELADLLFAFRVCKHVKSAEPRRLRAHCRMESRGSRHSRGPARMPDPGQRGRLRCLLPLRRWPGNRRRSRRHRGHPARRLDPRRRSDRRRRRRRDRHGVHRHAPFSALGQSIITLCGTFKACESCDQTAG
jgi:phosphoribosylaminoimidazolecarboxamide formyltransferase / IMP cyclohydrolase